MAQVEVDRLGTAYRMSAVMTLAWPEELALKAGDSVHGLAKAGNVLPVKPWRHGVRMGGAWRGPPSASADFSHPAVIGLA